MVVNRDLQTDPPAVTEGCYASTFDHRVSQIMKYNFLELFWPMVDRLRGGISGTLALAQAPCSTTSLKCPQNTFLNSNKDYRLID